MTRARPSVVPAPLSVVPVDPGHPPDTAEELLSTLKLCYNSLISCGDAFVANSKLLDVIRQVCPDPPPHTIHHPTHPPTTTTWPEA